MSDIPDVSPTHKCSKCGHVAIPKNYFYWSQRSTVDLCYICGSCSYVIDIEVYCKSEPIIQEVIAQAEFWGFVDRVVPF